MSTTLSRFGADYARHRAEEGRGHAGEELLSLPLLRSGPLARQWQVRACTARAFLHGVLKPFAARLGRPPRLLDLGAGNGWLSYRAALAGSECIALDIRGDDVDGLGAAGPFLERAAGRITRVIGAFDALPLGAASVDVAIFNASLHYALDLHATLEEAARVVRPGGQVVIADSPFYARERDGLAMVAEKSAEAQARFGDRADVLMALPFIEFLTAGRLEAASRDLGLSWRRRRVAYPLWYELRPAVAALKRARAPSRFDVWAAARP